MTRRGSSASTRFFRYVRKSSETHKLLAHFGCIPSSSFPCHFFLSCDRRNMVKETGVIGGALAKHNTTYFQLSQGGKRDGVIGGAVSKAQHNIYSVKHLYSISPPLARDSMQTRDTPNHTGVVLQPQQVKSSYKVRQGEAHISTRRCSPSTWG